MIALFIGNSFAQLPHILPIAEDMGAPIYTTFSPIGEWLTKHTSIEHYVIPDFRTLLLSVKEAGYKNLLLSDFNRIRESSLNKSNILVLAECSVFLGNF